MASTSEHKDDGPRVHNLGPAFIEYWNTVESKPVEEQLKKFKSDFFPKFPEFYQYKIDKWKKVGKNPDEELIKQLKEFPRIKAEFVQKTNDISASLKDTMKSFVQSFPDLDKDFDVYITHSFGDMDGGTRKIGEKIYFILGIEGMVEYHRGFASEVPFFHHELFHVYHGQFLPEDHVIWVSLWTEGLATYVSKKINPDAALKDMLLDLPVGMVSEIKKSWTSHWDDLISKLNSTKDEDYESYFWLSSKNKKIVKRSGYYLGYLVAEEIGKTKSISDMAKMKPHEILPLVKDAIQRIREKRD